MTGNYQCFQMSYTKLETGLPLQGTFVFENELIELEHLTMMYFWIQPECMIIPMFVVVIHPGFVTMLMSMQ